MRCAGAKKNYFDIDQRNSHPTIVSSLAEVVENPTLYPSLIQYGKADRLQREDLLRVVMVEWQCDRSVAKQLYNSLINTGTVNGWEKNNNLVHVDPILRPPFVTKYAGEAGRLIIAMAVRDPGTVEFARLTLDASSKFDPELQIPRAWSGHGGHRRQDTDDHGNDGG